MGEFSRISLEIFLIFSYFSGSTSSQPQARIPAIMPSKSKSKKSGSNKKRSGSSKPVTKTVSNGTGTVGNEAVGKVEIPVAMEPEDALMAISEKGPNPLYARGRATESPAAVKNGAGNDPTEEKSVLSSEKITDEGKLNMDGLTKDQDGKVDGTKKEEETDSTQGEIRDSNNNTPGLKADPPSKTKGLNPRLDQTVDLLYNYPKHPLQDDWTFWYFDAGKFKEWEKNLIKLADFSYVEDFWGVVNHLCYTNEARNGADFLVFKKGVQPMWEDPANRDGGRWMIKLEVRERENEKAHQAWIDLLLLVIGNNVDCRKITGVVFNIRANCDKMSMWLSTASRSDHDYIMEVGNAFKNILYGKFNLPLKFESHKDTQVKTKPPNAKSMYSLDMGGAGGGYRGSRSYHHNKYY